MRIISDFVPQVLKRNSFNETNEGDCKDNTDLSSCSGYLTKQISSVS